ncbi:hypothetical protein ES703_22435 [subsurface metagenome]
MKLSEAIEIGQLNVQKVGKRMPPDTLDALKVLIEAGKRIKDRRQSKLPGYVRLLPGETPEGDSP